MNRQYAIPCPCGWTTVHPEPKGPCANCKGDVKMSMAENEDSLLEELYAGMAKKMSIQQSQQPFNMVEPPKIDHAEAILTDSQKEQINKRNLRDVVCTDPKLGRKFDSDKLDYSLLPFDAIEEVIKVLMFGAKKYAPNNWKFVDDYERRYTNAAFRHLVAYKQGEIDDQETGISHLAHAVCCLLFLISKDGDAHGDN